MFKPACMPFRTIDCCCCHNLLEPDESRKKHLMRQWCQPDGVHALDGQNFFAETKKQLVLPHWQSFQQIGLHDLSCWIRPIAQWLHSLKQFFLCACCCCCCCCCSAAAAAAAVAVAAVAFIVVVVSTEWNVFHRLLRFRSLKLSWEAAEEFISRFTQVQ